MELDGITDGMTRHCWVESLKYRFSSSQTCSYVNVTVSLVRHITAKIQEVFNTLKWMLANRDWWDRDRDLHLLISNVQTINWKQLLIYLTQLSDVISPVYQIVHLIAVIAEIDVLTCVDYF